MVYRLFVERRKGQDNEAAALLTELRDLLFIGGLERVRIINRYDIEDIPPELLEECRDTVFSEPATDTVSEELETDGGRVFAVEYLPGQFDMRADSAQQCVRFISPGAAPVVRSAKVYVLYGDITDKELEEIEKYVVNPVEARLASLEKPETLRMNYREPADVAVLGGFTALDDGGLSEILKKYALAMDLDDLRFCRDYFASEKRDPTLTEIRMIDTYWSDHCRHTTFLTNIDSVSFADPTLEAAWNRYLDARGALGRTKPVCLMDIATVGAKYLAANGELPGLDVSDEINACTVKADITVDGVKEPWLILFKNETHNHPTEIEPFGGAATCIGGAIRDPLSGRAYVYGAMRVTGAADPTVPVSETLEGKLPQRKIVTTAAAGYSSYGNQIGLATGQVDEVYHPGYAAKRLEIGAVVAGVPQSAVRRETPAPGDVVILLGGRTGRDGCGGATGSSKSHTRDSIEECGSEVQKGNAPEERKLQRLFRDPGASLLIKRCNDFGAGGVSVAVGELADGLDIDLDKVPKKYEGLDGTELAISESQERMAVVVAPGDAEKFLAAAGRENLEATVIATVTAEPRLRMRWRGKTVVDVSREFLNSNGAPKHTVIAPEAPKDIKDLGDGTDPAAPFGEKLTALLGSLGCCSRRGLSERFDSTIGAGTVIFPFGGKKRLTPAQAMVQKVSLEKGHTDDCTVMAWGYDPRVAERSPYHGAYLAVVESLAKLVASGADADKAYLTFQEYFEKPGNDPARWGQPLSALLGALDAQLDFHVAAVGGKDSMSGSFEDLDVPPTLVSFAIALAKTGDIISSEFKNPGGEVRLISPARREDGLPDPASQRQVFRLVGGLIGSGEAVAVRAVEGGGAAEAVYKSCIGNGYGFSFAHVSDETLFGLGYGSFIVEMKPGGSIGAGDILGKVTADRVMKRGSETVSFDVLDRAYEDKLEGVYPCNIKTPRQEVPTVSFSRGPVDYNVIKTAKPLCLIPVFPGTNCEYDSARAMNDAGVDTDIFVINNLTAQGIERSVEAFARKADGAQIIFIPGGFSGGDEPDGSGKFITAFFRAPAVREAVGGLMDVRGGLMLGICNGFQALIKLGLVPFGKITDPSPDAPTLTFNTIGQHRSRIVDIRVASDLSPWLKNARLGGVYSVPISHGEGRFCCGAETARTLAEAGQIATQYCSADGVPSMDIGVNPNGSVFAVEGITSPDGRILGKMGHSERIGAGLYRNVPGEYDMGLFRSAKEFFDKN
ncbi:MAG: phosphoribosylformylglycinamidine synthase [Clostridia bacterium]|nr:phosphoribosylformylglycinamidine synthase [Clostridia bacterium]